jgi:ATP-dependent RNA helicase HelY
VLAVLRTLGYVDEWVLTEKGELLTRVYNEADLLVVEALEQGLLEGLDGPELAAVCSTLVFESRGPDAPVVTQMPTETADAVYRNVMKLWRRIRKEEDARGLELTREPDAGFAEKAYTWAIGKPLEVVLDEDDRAGDFVRSTKMLIDLLRQIQEVVPTADLAEQVERALEGLNRGVVAYSSLEF